MRPLLHLGVPAFLHFCISASLHFCIDALPWSPHRAAFAFSISSRFALNSFPVFHSGSFSASATR
jgi:hypothetical protein